MDATINISISFNLIILNKSQTRLYCLRRGRDTNSSPTVSSRNHNAMQLEVVYKCKGQFFFTGNMHS